MLLLPGHHGAYCEYTRALFWAKQCS